VAPVKDEAQAVVIGGGVGGCSIVYHLAKLGWRDVVLVEQYGLTHGSTWHSAGLVGQLRATVSLTKMMQSSVGLYADLARETGKDPGWHQLGGLRLASSRERYEEIQRQAGWAKSFGLEMELVSPAEAQAMFPPMSTDGVVAAAFAICISESTPSCMRAPPEAEMMISGYFRSMARCPSRAIFSPTTEPIDPPMNAKSMTARHTGIPPSCPVKVRIASPSPAAPVAFLSRAG